MTIDQATLDEIFANHPLKEVVFDMKFPLNLRVLRDICEFYDLVEDEYPKIEKEETTSPDKPTELRYIFQNTEKDKLLIVAEDEFMLQMNQYQSFENFLKEILKYVEIFCQLFKLHEIEGIRLKYINNLSIPLENEVKSIFKYVNPHLNLNVIESSLTQRFATQIQKKVGDYLLLSSSAFILQEKSENEGIYILDFDSFVNKRIAISNISTHLVSLHENIQKEFLSCITEEYKQIMRTQK